MFDCLEFFPLERVYGLDKTSPRREKSGGTRLSLKIQAKLGKNRVIFTYMGRKPKIIPYIPGTLKQIVDAIFAKDRAYIQAKTKKAKSRRSKNAQNA